MLASSLSQAGDFWGPLFCVLCYALIVIWGESSALSWSLCLWIVGSAGIFVLARALGGDVSYSQCVSAIGYSLLPLAVSMVLVMTLNAIVGESIVVGLVKVGGMAFSAYSASQLLIDESLVPRKLLIVYPIFLLYCYFTLLH
eukprot:SAG22_NODE_2035_length_3102_cov_3.066933_3_plen_142_part_00